MQPPHSSGGRRGKIQAESDEYKSDYKINKIQVLTLSKICGPRLVGNQFFEFSVHNTKSVENQLAKNILQKKTETRKFEFAAPAHGFSRYHVPSSHAPM